MLRCVVLLCLVQGLLAFMRSKEDVDAFKTFLYDTQKPLTKSLEERMAENPEAKAWEVSGKYQGDIMLTEDDIEQITEDYATNFTNVDSRNSIHDLNRRWPGGIVYYDIEPRFTQAQRNQIDSVARIFEDRTCVRWVRRTNQRSYVYITAHPEHGCSALIGTRGPTYGRHWLNLAPPGCLHWTIIFHEMAHSLGFYHMHQTTTRYNYVWIHWQNMYKEAHWHFHVLPNMNMLDLPYEYASNQHYGPYAFTNGRHLRVIWPRYNDNGQMGQRQFVTGLDIWRVGRLYRCPGAWSVQVTAQDVNKPYDNTFHVRMKAAADKELANKQIDDKSFDQDMI